jgi:hypothetical protein
MNDNHRPSRSTPDPHPVPSSQPTTGIARPEAPNGPGAVDDPFDAPGSHWLDRLAWAVTAGLTVAEPRSALLVADVLGPSCPRSTSPSTDGRADWRIARDPRFDA